MDINSLLSPQESPASETPPPVASPQPTRSPRKRPGRPTKRQSSGLAHQITSSPQLPSPQIQEQQLLTPALSHTTGSGYYTNGQYGVPSPGLVSNGRPVQQSVTSTPATERRIAMNSITETRPGISPVQPVYNRQTSGMDTLADLASMQRRQHSAQSTHSPRQNSGLPAQVYQTQQRTPPVASYTLENLPRTISATSASDIKMADPPPKEPRVFSASSLAKADLDSLRELAAYLSDHSYDYNSHINFVNLLHKGLMEHVVAGHGPRTYELLDDLRQARQAMDARFAVGEELWVQWLEDESKLATSTEELMSLMELYHQAVKDEPSSISIWRLYGNFVYQVWAACNDLEDFEGWTEEDKIINKEIFTWDMMIQPWEQGAQATQWRMNDSHIIFDRYIEILRQELDKSHSPQEVQHVRALFKQRLLKPHAEWDQTLQNYFSFISKYFPNEWEQAMDSARETGARAKEAYQLRERFERRIQMADQHGDRVAAWQAYSDYLGWEVGKKGVFSFNILHAQIQRATVRFPTDVNFWLDYVDLVIQHPNESVNLLDTLQRATRHAPWSGDLWSHRLLALEAAGKEFREMEEIKHKATETGVLDAGGLEELMKTYIAWGGFLRRRAFHPHAIEEDIDTAEMGINAALEHVRKTGEKQSGSEYKGDPLYRLERIHIKFFTQRGDLDSARKIWGSLKKTQKYSYDFWYRYYIWEMVFWSRHAVRNETNAGQEIPTPRKATSLLLEGIKGYYKMDWPEQLIQMYLNHCEQHETVQELQRAVMLSRRYRQLVASRRRQEAGAAATAAIAQAEAEQDVDVPMEDVSASSKRRRDTSLDRATARGATKRSKEDNGHKPDLDLPTQSDAPVPPEPAKRDRENATVLVKNLSSTSDETSIRKFFTKCGTVLSVKIRPEDSTALVEFDSGESAEFALTKHKRTLDGSHISLSLGSGTVLWLANYPPSADEAYFKKLFADYGEIVDIRFPSLAIDSHRRFCYIQFLTRQQAEAATQLNGTGLGYDPKTKVNYNLVAKISNPAVRQDRTGAAYEGREIFVGNLDFQTTEPELRELCSSFGKVERVRIPRNAGGLGKGSGFVIFEEKLAAENAVKGLEGKTFRRRLLRVTLGKPPGKVHATSRLVLASASPEPAIPSRNATSPSPMPPANGDKPSEAGDTPQIRERQVILLGVPETVNSARIQALAEQHGSVRKITLRPNKQAAIIEYETITEAAQARPKLNGHEIAPGRKLRTGTHRQLQRMQREFAPDRLDEIPVAKRASKDDDTMNLDIQPATKSTLMQPRSLAVRGGAARGGHRGGLGSHRSQYGSGVSGTGTGAHGEKPKPKGNADFRAMLLGRKKGSVDKAADEKSEQ